MKLQNLLGLSVINSEMIETTDLGRERLGKTSFLVSKSFLLAMSSWTSSSFFFFFCFQHCKILTLNLKGYGETQEVTYKQILCML